MPYIESDERTVAPPMSFNPGQLTYELQQSIQKYLEYTGLRYQHLAECLGALEGAKLDLIERIIKPYEAKKLRENGDVWPESLLSRPERPV